MIKIFSKEITNFNNNGLGILRDSIFCKVNEELNGLFELEMEYPLFGVNKDTIVEENIIMAPTPRGEQPFRIYSTETNLGTIYINAKHIFYDLLNNFLEDVRPTNQNGAGALNWILSNTQFPHNFTTNSNIIKSSSASYIRKGVVEPLLGEDENSFLNRWGGELVRDKWNIAINEQAGEDRGVKITYGKNLTGLNASVDISNVITRVMPTGLKEDDTVLTLPEKYIDSPNIGYYSSPRITHYHYSDIKVSEELSEAQALVLLRQQASLLFSENKIHEPLLNAKVDFLELSKTEEYKDYSQLETIYPFDIVTVEYEGIGFTQKAKMISYEYDCLLEKYNSIELGQFLGNYADSQAKVAQLLQKVSEGIVSQSDLQTAIDNATDLLNNALGGYVLKRPGELLIMDTENPNTATKVWRWNINGLGYSSTGINGPYGTAITMNGAIVANFITTGTLNANLIKAGVLQDKLAKNNINMDTGTFSFGNGKITFDGNNLNIKLSDNTGLETKLNSKVNSSDFGTLIEQNSSNVQIAVGQTSGRNIIKNSAFKFGNAGWRETKVNGYIDYSAGGFSVGEKYGVQLTNNALNNMIQLEQYITNLYIYPTKLTFSGWISTVFTTVGTTNPYADLQLQLTYADDTVSYHNLMERGTSPNNGWNYYTKTITTTKPIKQIRFGLYLRDIIGKLLAAQLQLVEGAVPPAWSPHPDEMKGTKYTFDGDGFTIGSIAGGDRAEHTPQYSQYNHGDGSYTRISHAGLERIKSSEVNPYHYLYYAEEFFITPTKYQHTHYYTVPAEFQGKPFKAFALLRSVDAFSKADFWVGARAWEEHTNNRVKIEVSMGSRKFNQKYVDLDSSGIMRYWMYLEEITTNYVQTSGVGVTLILLV